MALSDIFKQKFARIRNAQKAIRNAIIEKGISVSGNFETYADAVKLLKNPQGTKNINANGNYTIADFESVNVNVPQISTTSKTISANGNYTAPSGTAWNNVTVNVPANGIHPSGTLDIDSNGTYDVTEKASVNVSVPVGVFPSGSQNIVENGTYDVKNLESVNVNVPIPAGTEVVTGQVSGSGSKILTISAAAGKENIAVFLISTTSSNLSVSTITGAGYISGSMYMTYKSSSNIMRLSTTASYNKSTGAISYTGSSSYNFTNNTNLKYMFVAW